MAGFRGQVRVPAVGRPRERRNSTNLASNVQFINPNSAIQVDGNGKFSLVVASGEPFTQSSAGLAFTVGDGLEKTGLAVAIDLAASNPGLQFSSGDLAVLVQSPITVDASGIDLSLATDPGLEDSTGLRVQLDGTTLTRGASGLSVTNPEGLWTVTAVQTGTYGASVGEIVRADPSGGTFTINLPTAASIGGQGIWIKNVTADTTAITVDGNGSETIDGATTVSMTTARQSLYIVSDGTNWMTMHSG